MRVAKAVFVLSAMWSPAALAQVFGPCDVIINKVSVPEVAIYNSWDGKSVGKLPARHFVPGLKVESCAPNFRMRVTVNERAVWIDSFSVETNVANAPLAPGAVPAFKAFPLQRKNDAGHRARLRTKNDEKMVLTTYKVELPPLPPKRPNAQDPATPQPSPVIPRPIPDRTASASKQPTNTSPDLLEITWPTSIGHFGDWSAYEQGTGKDRMCFAVAQPEKRSGPADSARDTTYLFVTMRAASATDYEVALVASGGFRENVPATIELGATKIALLTRQNHAWIEDERQQTAIVDVMRKVPVVAVKRTSWAGKSTAATFPLKGFEQALDTITKQCR